MARGEDQTETPHIKGCYAMEEIRQWRLQRLLGQPMSVMGKLQFHVKQASAKLSGVWSGNQFEQAAGVPEEACCV